MKQRSQLKLALASCIITMLSSCGDDYQKNPEQKQTDNVQTTHNDANASKKDPSPGSSATIDQQNIPENEQEELSEQGSGNQSQQDSTPNNNSSGVTLQDLLSGLFGGGSGNQAGNTTPIPPAPEPSSDDCIGADEFICAIEVAITYHTNLIRAKNRHLTHHARLSYVARDWSQKQMQRGSIGHQGFPTSRRQVYSASFPSESVSIQAENVAYSSGRSEDAEAIAKMFVNMWTNSAGHRRNMLGNYGIIGVGVTKSGNSYYATQLFGQE